MACLRHYAYGLRVRQPLKPAGPPCAYPTDTLGPWPRAGHGEAPSPSCITPARQHKNWPAAKYGRCGPHRTKASKQRMAAACSSALREAAQCCAQEAARGEGIEEGGNDDHDGGGERGAERTLPHVQPLQPLKKAPPRCPCARTPATNRRPILPWRASDNSTFQYPVSRSPGFPSPA
eukprot:1619820-Rhodomonas_salina.2